MNGGGGAPRGDGGEAPPRLSRRELLRLAALAGSGAFITSCRQGVILRDERDLATAALTDARAGTEWAHRATDTPPAQKSTPHPAPSARSLGVDTGIALTANPDFYTMKFHPSAPPVIDPATWRLTVGGEVATPLSLGLADLQARPVATLMRTLECISNPAGGTLIGNAVWQGLRLADVLAQAQPTAAGRNLTLESADGYHTGIPIELATDPESYLVFAMNGVPLPPEHGFPVRCLFPGRYGQKQPKWLTAITLQATPHRGHWEKQGWSDTAVIQVNSRIDSATRPKQPGEPVVVRGIAFGDASGIASVELIVDKQDGYPATLLRQAPVPFTPYTWTEWEWTWTNPPPGNHVIQAKAKDGNGFAQNSPRKNLLAGTFPDGTSDMPQVAVQVPGA